MSILFLYLYLGGAVLLGILCAHRIHGADDYYVAGRQNGVLHVAGSLLATVLGSSAILGSIDFAYTKGWAGAWFMLCGALGLFGLSFMTRRLGAFKGYNLPELLGTFYGTGVKRLSGAVIALAWLGVVGAQLIGAAEITVSIFGIPYVQAVLLIGTALTLYTSIGGQLSVMRTDLLQAALIFLGLLLIFLPLFSKAPHLEAQPLISTKFTLLDLAMMLVAYASTYLVGPDIYSRIFCARDDTTARRALRLTAAILVPIAFLLAYIGIYGATFHAGGKGSVFFTIVRGEFSGPVTILLYFSLLSAILSSADTTLFTAGTLLSQFFVGDMTRRTSIRITAACTLFLGILSMATTLLFKSILPTLLFALSIYSGAFVLPTLWGMLGLKANRLHAYSAIITGGLLALIGKLLGGTIGNALFFLAFALNLAILALGHFQFNRRISNVSDASATR